MYKRYETSWLKHFDFLLSDILAIVLAYVTAYGLRFGLSNFLDSGFYLAFVFLLLVLHGCTIFFDENYQNILQRGYLNEAKACLQHTFILSCITLLFLYLTKQINVVSRFFFILLMCFTLVYGWIGRSILKLHLRKNTKDTHKRNILVLTTERMAASVLETLSSSTETQIVGLCLVDADCPGKLVGSVPVVATPENLLDYIKRNVVDGLFLSLPNDFPVPSFIVNTCLSMGVSVHYALTTQSDLEHTTTVENMGGYAVLTQSVHIVTARQVLLKRFVDICAGLVGLVVTGIAFLFVAPAIYIASPGPIFFSQIRVGKNGRKFKIYKFRSMYMDAEERKKELMAQNKIADGMMFKMDNDPRIIKGIGHFIRDYSIDELPQLWNVLKGDMSLVGTRPPTVDEYEKYDYHHKIRLAIKPGITGMWQVSGRSNITDFEEVVRLDSSYITNWSLGLDLKILLKTVKVVLMGDGAS